jgi:hypothetical protein
VLKKENSWLFENRQCARASRSRCPRHPSFGLSLTAQAANETTTNFNTGEGSGALQSVTTGTNNSAMGFDALFSDTNSALFALTEIELPLQ